MGLFRKSSGGKLSNVDVTFTSVELTTKPFGEKTSDKFGESLYAVLHLTPDGSEEAVFVPLKIGKAEDYEVSGLTLSTTNTDVVHPSSQFGKLLASMIEAGVSEDTFIESPDAQEADFSALVGTRARTIYKEDAEVQEKFGKKKFTRADGTKGETDRRYLAVSQVYELGEGGAQPKTVTQAKGGKPNGKAVQVTAEQVTEETVAAIVRESPGRKLQRSKLAAKLALKLGKGHAFAKQAQELVNDDDWMGETHKGFTYDADSQQLSL